MPPVELYAGGIWFKIGTSPSPHLESLVHKEGRASISCHGRPCACHPDDVKRGASRIGITGTRPVMTKELNLRSDFQTYAVAGLHLCRDDCTSG
jgi:hypothetical protein